MDISNDFSNENLLKNELEKGNHKALIFLMDKFHKLLCTYVYSLSRDYELTQDIVQEVFIKIWEDRDRIQNIKNVRSYLYKSVYNGLLNQWRKNSKMLPVEEEHLQALTEIVDQDNDELLQQQIKLVHSEVQNLPIRCKETFLLSKQDGLTNIEIANYMNVSTRTVEAQMNKAFKILREKLQDRIKPILFFFLGLDSKIKKTTLS